MHNHSISKRKRQAILFFSYGFMTLATVVMTVVCLLWVLGYQFDVRHGTIVQGGLLQFKSAPTGATVAVDGRATSSLTPSKLEVAAGGHRVTMTKTGYLPWQKDISIKAGELRWLDYARLLPSKLTTTNVRSVGTATQALASPDHRMLVTIDAAAPLTLTLYDIHDLAKVTTKSITLPTTLVAATDPPATVQIVEWDSGSRYVLLSYTSGEAIDYVRLDKNVDQGAPINLSREFGMAFRAMHFVGTSGNVYYAMTDHDLRRVDLGAKSVSAPLISQVESYVMYGDDTIAFIATRESKKIAGLYRDATEIPVRTLAAGEPLWVDVAEYFSDTYYAIGSRTHVDIIKDPIKTTKLVRPYATLSLPYEIAWLNFSDNGRMLVAGSGRSFINYDLETSSQVVVHPDEAGSDSVPTWLDNYYLIDNPAGVSRWYEFDGANSHDLMPSERGWPQFVSSDEKNLLSFVRTANGMTLQSTRLIVP